MSARHRVDQHWQGSTVGHHAAGAPRFIPGLAAGWVVGHCVTCRSPVYNDDRDTANYTNGELRCEREHQR